MLHDLQNRWYVPVSSSFEMSADTILVALIACTTLHWITTPETADSGEHGTAQALGIGFDDNDKESATVVETSQLSGSQRSASDGQRFGLNKVL